MLRRFYSEQSIETKDAATAAQVTIEGDEAQHILNVNRLGIGDELLLFDGNGNEFRSIIVDLEKKRLRAEIVETIEVSRESSVDLTLAVALPKGDRQKILVEKLVEVGVTRLIPLDCQRSVARCNEKAIERLRRRVIEASKQSGRNVLMQIHEGLPFTDLLSQFEADHIRLIAHPYNAEPFRASAEKNKRFVVAIGPEGGFSDQEIESALTANWQCMSFARTIMRVETAALVAATMIGLNQS